MSETNKVTATNILTSSPVKPITDQSTPFLNAFTLSLNQYKCSAHSKPNSTPLTKNSLTKHKRAIIINFIVLFLAANISESVAYLLTYLLT